MKSFFLSGLRMMIFLIVVTFTAGAQETEPVLVSNVFVETDLRQALTDISAQVGIPIITDSFVQGLVSVEFYDTPLEQCLEMLLSPLGFTFKNVGEYYVVTSLNPRSPSFNLVSRTEKIPLKHIKAVDAVYNLPGFLLPFIKINQDKNILTITAPDMIIRRMNEEISLLDTPPKQVSIEVVVTELSEDAVDEIGLEWGEEFSLNSSGQYQLNVGVETLSTFQLIGDLATQTLLAVQMMAREGDAHIRASPRILATDTAEAVIEIGTDKYVAVETGSGGSSYSRLQSVSAGIKLKIVPFIGDEDDIILEVETEVSDILPGSAKEIALSVARRSASTTVHLSDGQTIGIGGLVQENEAESTTRVPLLGDIPVLKNLFSSKKTASVRTELIIFITPRIVRPGSTEAAAELRESPPVDVDEGMPEEKPRLPVGLNFSLETGVTDAIDESRVFYLEPSFSYELFDTGLSVRNTWEIPVNPLGTVRPMLAEIFTYEFEDVPVSVKVEHTNGFPLGAEAISGSASFGLRFADLFFTRLVFTYLPGIDLGIEIGLQHEIDVVDGFSIGIGGESSITFVRNPGLHFISFYNYYYYALDKMSFTLGIEPRVDFLQDGSAVFDITPYARIGLSL